MSQQAVERALGKLLTDEDFRERFFKNPELASWEAGFTLSPVELEALSRLSHEALSRFSEGLDKRISRPFLDPDRPAAGFRATEADHERPHRAGSRQRASGDGGVGWGASEIGPSHRASAPAGPPGGGRGWALLAGLAGFGVWHFLLAGPGVPLGVIAVSGRIEGDDSAIAAKTSGRIREITVREGDRVEAGQANASYTQARWDRDAYSKLFKKELIAEPQAKQAESNEEAQAAIVAASRRRVEASRGALTAAKPMLANPAIRSAQAAAVRGQIPQAAARARFIATLLVAFSAWKFRGQMS